MCNIGRVIDEATLEFLLLERAEKMRGYISSRIPLRLLSSITADDILQEVWLAAFRKVSNCRFDGSSSFERWIMTIVDRKLVDAIRNGMRVKRGLDKALAVSRLKTDAVIEILESAVAPGRTPSREASSKETLKAVGAYLDQLPEDHHRVVRLRYFEGFSLREIAESMNKTEAAVRGLLFRGVENLRRQMGAAGKYFTDVASSDTSAG